MIVLTNRSSTTTQKLVLTLGGSATTTYPTATVDSYIVPPQSKPDFSEYRQAPQFTLLTSASETTIADAPPEGSVKMIPRISIPNPDTVAMTMTVAIDDNGTNRNQIGPVTLAVGDSLNYEDDEGWYAMDISGNRKTALAAATNWAVTTLTVATKMSAAYMWTAWNPSDVAGSYTNAASTASSSYADSTYFTQSNSSGTVTLTFVKAGSYVLNLVGGIGNGAAYSAEDVKNTLGGTATIYRLNLSTLVIGCGDSAADGDWRSTETIGVVATAGQTVTILPAGRVTSGGVTSNFSIAAGYTVMYCGG